MLLSLIIAGDENADTEPRLHSRRKSSAQGSVGLEKAGEIPNLVA